jgi:3,4-dihydroxy-9,10-secoandrosta-1,3,5(10)-triene-9,17-dione 4,5-dioxygenase
MVGINHFMVEVADLDMVGRALDVAASQGEGLSLTLGKHTNDHMLSFYVKSPSGFMVEYGTAGRLIDEATWITAYYDSASYWGHKNSAPKMAGALPPGGASNIDV